MNTEIYVTSPEDSLDLCLKRMMRMDAPAIPVVEGGQLVGMISLDDVYAWTIPGTGVEDKNLIE